MYARPPAAAGALQLEPKYHFRIYDLDKKKQKSVNIFSPVAVYGNNDHTWAINFISIGGIEGEGRAHENDVFSSFQIQLRSDAAYLKATVVRDAGNFFLATFVDDEVDVPFGESGDCFKVSSIQLWKWDYREWRFAQSEPD